MNTGNVIAFIPPKGELKKRAVQYSLWTDALFGEDWGDTRDIEVITLKQHLEDQAIEEAWTNPRNLKTIDRTIDKLCETKYTHAKEFVKIQKDKFTVGVNFHHIDDKALTYALYLLTQVEDFNKPGVNYFGEDIEVNVC